jgi:hypothetical protein
LTARGRRPRQRSPARRVVGRPPQRRCPGCPGRPRPARPARAGRADDQGRARVAPATPSSARAASNSPATRSDCCLSTTLAGTLVPLAGSSIRWNERQSKEHDST